MPGVPRSGSVGARLWNVVTGLNTAAYRSTGGRLGGLWKRRNPILLLEHEGRRTGKRRTTPLVYLRDGEDYVVVASRGGSDDDPGWLHNLRGQPHATIQVGADRHDVVARVADPEERARLWPTLVEFNPDYGVYEGRTERVLPVVLLRPVGS